MSTRLLLFLLLILSGCKSKPDTLARASLTLFLLVRSVAVVEVFESAASEVREGSCRA